MRMTTQQRIKEKDKIISEMRIKPQSSHRRIDGNENKAQEKKGLKAKMTKIKQRCQSEIK